MGAVGLLVLIVCVNLANLLLARGERRLHEFGIRAALGAGRLRLAMHALVEGDYFWQLPEALLHSGWQREPSRYSLPRRASTSRGLTKYHSTDTSSFLRSRLAALSSVVFDCSLPGVLAGAILKRPCVQPVITSPIQEVDGEQDLSW